jgi:hypothetical protein
MRRLFIGDLFALSIFIGFIRGAAPVACQRAAIADRYDD